MTNSETPLEFRTRRRREVARLLPATFWAALALRDDQRDIVENQLEAMYAHGWLAAYRQFKETR